MENEKKEIRVAFYIRVSTLEQKKHGYSLEFQEKLLYDVVDYRSNKTPKWVTDKSIHYIDDGYSGGDLNRPGYRKMIEDAKKGKFDMIAVWKIDRLSRNLSHLLRIIEELETYKISFYSDKENIDFSGPIGRFTFQIFGALAEFERETIRSRTHEGKKYSASVGNYVSSGTPFGYKKVPSNKLNKGNILEIVEAEAMIVKKIFYWFVYEDLNYEDIARRLNSMKIEKGENGPRGKVIKYTEWYGTTVTDILIRTEYKGFRDYKTKEEGKVEIVRIPTPKIVSDYEFDQAQIKIGEIHEKKTSGKPKYLLSRKIYDVESGRTFIGVMRTKGGHSYRLKKYTTKNGIERQGVEYPGEPIDKFVWSYIEKFIKRPEYFVKLYKKGTTELGQIDILQNEISMLYNRIDNQEVFIENVERKELSGGLSEEKAERYITEANKIIVEARNKIAENEKNIERLLNLQLTDEVIRETAKHFKDNIDNLTLEQKRRLVGVLVDKIYLSTTNDNKIQFEVVFKFNPKVVEKVKGGVELEDGEDSTKNTPKGDSDSDNGAPGRI